ncbi:Alpha-latrotoxin-Lh1a-like protein [Cladobotryum mycophilum]|uniref:Alpha-latrotoxin-Lh1a-like protein n=1 Tax=Cladobotryum mycophilum TaxID=491253 RepID=A0ABR0S9M9_9HYPO
MFYQNPLLILLFLPLVHADGWDDFSNNLATDLAPILSLFGEQVTKQYLSESITMVDYFIFAMAPMGILTAVVSAIRVCGSPSLRAFIGRAQEGGGNAEAELCSSTSRDVCELYNNGGIARVFGRPKILEVVYDPSYARDGKWEAGIFTFHEYIKTEAGKKEWNGQLDPEDAREPFAPNLSLNVGIKRQSQAVFLAVAMLGLLLQVTVLILAAVVTYYLRWDKDGKRPDSYACPLTIAGTVLVCSGCFLCAFLVGQSTNEQVFCRTTDSRTLPKHPSSIYWIQPGNQVLGDQIFDPFCSTDEAEPLREYISSFKERSKTSELKVWTAVGTTVIGFVLQFVGLRGIHSAVSVAQLGAIMLMSLARSALRMKRLKTEDNLLAGRPDEVTGYELDWLALLIGYEAIKRDLKPQTPNEPDELPRYFWGVSGIPNHGERLKPGSPLNQEPGAASKLLALRTRLAKLTQSVGTKSGKSANFDVKMVEVREEAQRLATAIETAANTIFKDKGANFLSDWKEALSMQWGITCHTSSLSVRTTQNDNSPPAYDETQYYDTIHICLKRQSPEYPWELVERLEIESILGLWLWSLKSDPIVETCDSQGFTVSWAHEIPTRRIVSMKKDFTALDLTMWLSDGLPGVMESPLDFHSGQVRRVDPSSIWIGEIGRPFRTMDSPDILTEIHRSNVNRLFGWPADTLQISDRLSVWTIPERCSLLRLCSQQILALFITSTLDIASELGDTKVCEGTSSFYLENNLVSEMAKSFTDHQLGTAEEALLCILPQITAMLQPPAKTALDAAQKAATQYRRAKKWSQADAILKWAWKICMESQATEETMEAATSLCDLCWWALAIEDDEQMRKSFGHDVIRWLALQRSGQPPCVSEIIDRYTKVSELIIGTANSSSQMVHDDLISAMNGEDVTETLFFLSRSTSEEQPLSYASERGHDEVVKLLLESGRVDANLPNWYGRIPLHSATNSVYSNEKTIRLLIESGQSNVEMVDSEGQTPLLWAAESSHTQNVKALIDVGNADVTKTNGEGWTALHLAVHKGRKETVKLLLEYEKVDPNVKNRGITPLLLAVRGNRSEIVKLLLDTGKVDADCKDNNGRTPLWQAVSTENTEIVKLLLDTGKVDVDYKDNNGRTPRSWAMISRYTSPEMVKLLLDSGKVNVFSKDKNGETPLSYAEKNGNEKNRLEFTQVIKNHITCLEDTLSKTE